MISRLRFTRRPGGPERAALRTLVVAVLAVVALSAYPQAQTRAFAF